MSAVPVRPGFPEPVLVARAFFEEGIRHLEDACLLHGFSRYPASIASAIKGAEFGVKFILILDGAMGWWDKMFTTHSPFSDISRLPPFDSHIVTLTAYSATLVQDVKAMENLVPAKPGGTFDIEAQQNPEYPFLSYEARSSAFALNKPATHFAEADSKKYYSAAQDLLTAVATQYATVSGWKLTIPASL
jgi:hypothetical protein